MAQTSTLRIIIDSQAAQKNAKALDEQVNKLEKSGDDASKSFDNFGKNLNKGAGSVAKYRESITAMSRALAGVSAIAVGAATAVAGLAISAANSARELENMARLSDAGVVEFQRIAVAAARYGVTSEQLSDQLKDFNEKLGEFVLTGAGEGKDAFEVLAKNTKMSSDEVGKFALELQRASGPEALLLYVAKLEEAGVSQEQLSFLVENMGNDLTKLLPILQDGGKELNLLADEAERLGVILDEEAVANAIRLEEEINKLKKQAQGATNQFVSGFIPALTQVADGLNDGAVNAGLMKQAGEDLGDVLKVVTSIAFGAYVAISSVSRAILAVVEDTANAKKGIDKAAEGQGFLANLPGVKFTKALLLGGASAATGTGVETSKAYDTNARLAEEYTSFLDKIQGEQDAIVARSTKNQKDSRNGITAGLKEFNEIQAKEAKAAADKASKDAEAREKELQRIRDEQYNTRERIQYQYADRAKKIEIDLANEIKEIQGANFSPQDTAGFTRNAQIRADIEKQLYTEQLAAQLNEFQDTEEQKLARRVAINELIIALDADLNDELKAQALKSLLDQSNYEAEQIRLAKERRLLAANEVFLSEKQKIEQRYALEREEILKNKQLSESERQTQISGSFGREAQDTAQAQQGVAQRYLGAIGVDYSAEQQAQERRNAITEALEFELITQEEYQQRMLESQRAYEAAKLDTSLASAEAIFGNLSSMFDKTDDRQKAFYRTTLALEKAAAIARSVVAIQTAVALAAATPFPGNLGAIATVVAQTASIVGNIKSVSEGFQSGGYTGDGGVSEVAGVVHREEYVLNATATKRIGVDTLNTLNSGGSLGGSINVNIQNLGTPQTYEVQQLDENNVRIIARDEVRKTFSSDLQNPNSQISKSISQNTNAPRRRG